MDIAVIAEHARVGEVLIGKAEESGKFSTETISKWRQDLASPPHYYGFSIENSIQGKLFDAINNNVCNRNFLFLTIFFFFFFFEFRC